MSRSKISQNRNEYLVRLGQCLANHRISKGLGVGELAGHLGVTPSRLRRIEEGDARVEASLLYALAQALDLKVAELFDGEAGEEFIPLDPEARKLMRYFASIESTGIRRSILKLAKALSEKP